MSDTISEFTNFISNDPLMLALCIAIVVLIIVFILVLIFGKKKEDAEEVSENTGALLTTDINDANLKSTQEFAAVNQQEPTPEVSSTKKIPVVPPAEDITDKEAPISVDDALKLKEEREKTTTLEVVSPTPAPEAPAETPVEAPAAPEAAPAEADPFNLNNTPAPAASEIPPAEPITIAPEAAAVPEVPAEPAEAAPVIPDGALPGIPDSTVNNSEDTNGMFGNLVESLNEENKDQVISAPEAPAPAPAPEVVEPTVAPEPIAPEVPAEPVAPEAPQVQITTGNESSASVPLAGSPVVKEEKKVNFEPGAKAAEVITGNEAASPKEEPKVEAPQAEEADDIELPMFSTPLKDDKLDSISGESFNI